MTTASPNTIAESESGARAPRTDARVGVIIPVYNRPRIVLDAVACVTRQTRKPHRLVIVDDGSTDDTAANIETRLSELRPNFEVRLIRQTNQGVAAARNRAAQELTDCDLLAMLDSDDQWSDNFLACMTPLFAEPGVVAASCDAVYVDEASGQRRHRKMQMYASDTTRRIFLYGPPATPGTMVRREAYDAVGGFDATLKVGEDTALLLRISLRGRWAWCGDASLTVRRSGAPTVDEAAHLTQLADRTMDLRRVVDLEKFVRTHRGAAMRWRVWRRALASQWMYQGRCLEEVGASNQAAWAYWRATMAAPWDLRCWLKYLRCRCQGAPQHPL